MRRHAIIGALLLIGLGVILGATVFRTDIAQATGLAQSVTVNNTAENPARVHEQGTANVNVTNSSLKVVADLEPYEHSEFFNQDDSTCTQFVCHVSFPAVPAGKQLVVTYASARYRLTAGGSSPSVRLGVNGNGGSQPQILLPAPVTIGFDGYIASGPVSFYAKAGDVPTLSLGGQFVNPVSNTAHASIVGYLVDAP